MADRSIILSKGQAVPWPQAPGGVAQIDELLTRRVRLIYPTRAGKKSRHRRPIVNVREIARLLADHPIILNLHNPFARAVRGQSKTFTLLSEAKDADHPQPC